MRRPRRAFWTVSRLASCAAFVLASGWMGACSSDLPPKGEVVLYLDTNVIVPQAADAPPDPARPPPLVDRVRFDVRVAGEPVDGASREFAVDEALFRAKKVSIGIVPPPRRSDLTVRVRLFRADRALASEPPAGVTLDTTVSLPPVGSDGSTEVTAFLDAEDFGRATGAPTPIPALTGAPGVSRVGTWERGRHVLCASQPPPPPGTACVPGGVFFLGDPALRGRTIGNDIVSERAVVLSPFFVDVTEVTVGAFRSAWPTLLAAGRDPPLAWTGPEPKPTGDDPNDYCTWTPEPAVADGRSHDDLPINCLSWDTARAYCQTLGMALPSEAQYEYLMSGLGRELGYPWGYDEPDCAAAVWGRAGTGAFASDPSTCRLPPSIGGVAFPGSGTRDRVRGAGGVEIVDLAGNVSEWALDRWSRPDEAYWQPVVLMTDPVADLISPADGERRPDRGGGWLQPPTASRAGFRLVNAATDRLRGTGFRCALRAEAAP